jgi:hypothetical protein
MGIEEFERRLERLVEGTFAKAFRGQLQPVEIGKRLKREMDLLRTVSVRELISPNVFDITLSQDDFERFGAFIDVLAGELVEGAEEHARVSRYKFLGPVEVTIEGDPTYSKSTFTIKASVVEGEIELVGTIVLANGRRVRIGNEPILIGRLEDCTIMIEDGQSSRHHAQIQRQGEAIWVLDLHSTNGTKVNGVPITQQRLADGDVITIGFTPLRFEVN